MSKPVHIGAATLYNADCRDVLPLLGKVDAVVTDPPFGIGFRYESHDDSEAEYPALIKFVVSEFERLCDGPKFVWQSMKTCEKWAEWFPPGWRIFASCKGFVQLRPVELQYAWDPVICWGMASGKHADAIRDWHVVTTPIFGAGRESIDHPCPRPIEAVSYIVSGIKRPGTILDPFMGSGTTGIACARFGRPFIGIEKDPKYFALCCKRIEEAQRQSDLFIKQPEVA